MYFESFKAALVMDGHGVFVWTAYGIAVIAISLILISPKLKERKILRQIAGEIRRQQAHADSSEGGT
jgi:heme exporter protein D